MKTKPGLYWDKGKQRYFLEVRKGDKPYTREILTTKGAWLLVHEKDIRRFPEEQKEEIR